MPTTFADITLGEPFKIMGRYESLTAREFECVLTGSGRIEEHEGLNSEARFAELDMRVVFYCGALADQYILNPQLTDVEDDEDAAWAVRIAWLRSSLGECVTSIAVAALM
jgi:hypothetical protein